MTGQPRPALGPVRRLAAGLGAAFVTLAVLALLAVIGAVWMFNAGGPAAAQGQSTIVVLRSGAGLNEISGDLARAGVIRSAPLFSAAAQLSGKARALRAGEYEFASRASMAQVLGKIRRGEVLRHFVTIPEGMPSEMVVDRLMAQDLLTGSVPVPPEGSILPETYEFTRGEDRAAVMARMMAARDKVLAELWAQRAPDLPLKSPDEAVTLASIVEKETSVPEERPKIARVFVNRLNMGMKLESDPTIIYDITHGRPLGRGIRLSEKNAATAHNTYFIEGLPPSPITNPGRAALAAVLSPPPGDWLYFVADGTGGHAFSNTYEEHARNVEKWRKIEQDAAAEASGAAAREAN